MKVIFDSAEEKDIFMKKLSNFYICPHELIPDSKCTKDNCMFTACKDCWEKYLDYEIKGPSIVDFAEEFFGCELLEWQKNFLIECYETYKEKGELHYIPSRGSANSHVLLQLQACAALYDEFLKKEKRDGSDKD